jgi:hypothetical protein
MQREDREGKAVADLGDGRLCDCTSLQILGDLHKKIKKILFFYSIGYLYPYYTLYITENV